MNMVRPPNSTDDHTWYRHTTRQLSGRSRAYADPLVSPGQHKGEISSSFTYRIQRQ